MQDTCEEMQNEDKAKLWW